MADAAAAGFCGKVPARADFVARRLPVSLVEDWHAWIADVMAAARTELGEAWLDCYLRGPIWRFALGTELMAGVLMPSVDNVGRYFPLTVARRFATAAALAAFAVGSAAWFAAAEEAALAALEDGADLAAIDERIAALPPPDEISGAAAITTGRAVGAPGSVMRFDPDLPTPPFAAIARTHLERGNTLWWTLGAERVDPVAVVAIGRPGAASFPAMLSGRWAAQGWHEEEPLGGISSDFPLDKDGVAP